MSYSITVAGDALSTLRAVDPWLQEEFWDEVELLADKPFLLQDSPSDRDLPYVFHRIHDGAHHYFKLTLICNDKSQSILVLGIVHREWPLVA